MFLKSKSLKNKTNKNKTNSARNDRFTSNGEGVQFFANIEDYQKQKKEAKNESL